MTRRALVCLAAAFLFVACGDDPQPDPEPVVADAGQPRTDAGNPPEPDAGSEEDDAGAVEEDDAGIGGDDAGTGEDDAGADDDAGIEQNDAGSDDDAGVEQNDAGTEENDAGVDEDAGIEEPDAGPQIACGNGVVEAGEGCDDHNLSDGDGCSATCQVEFGTCGTLANPVVPLEVVGTSDGAGGYVVTGDTTGQLSASTTQCEGLTKGSGPEVVYSVNPAELGTGDLVAETSSTSSLKYTVVLRGVCDAPSSRCASGEAGETKSVWMPIDGASSQVFLRVDSNDGTTGSFEVHVYARPFLSAGEVCPEDRALGRCESGLVCADPDGDGTRLCLTEVLEGGVCDPTGGTGGVCAATGLACADPDGDGTFTCARTCEVVTDPYYGTTDDTCPSGGYCLEGTAPEPSVCISALRLGEPCDGSLPCVRPGSCADPEQDGSSLCMTECVPSNEYDPCGSYCDDSYSNCVPTTCLAVAGGTGGVCVPAVAAGEPCTAADYCVTGYSCGDPDGDGASRCTRTCDIYNGYDSCSYNEYCLAGVEPEPSLCVPALVLGEACDGTQPCVRPGVCADPQQDGLSTCLEECDVASSWSYCSSLCHDDGSGMYTECVPTTCVAAEGFSGVCAPAVEGGEPCTEFDFCVSGYRCYDLDGDGASLCEQVCNPDSWSPCPSDEACSPALALCVPAAAEGEACDPSGALSACASGLICHGGGDGADGTCVTSCWTSDSTYYYQLDPSSPFDGYRHCDTDMVCLDPDGNRRGACLPMRAEGEACDPLASDDHCGTRLACSDTGAGGVCERTGSCTLPFDVASRGATGDPQTFRVLGHLEGAGSDLAAGLCSDTMAGRDDVHLFTVPTRAWVRAIVWATDDYYGYQTDSVLYVRTSCEDDLTELACADELDASNEWIDLPPQEAGTQLYFVVDEFGSSSVVSSYSLFVKYWPVPADGEACDPDGLLNACDTTSYCSDQTQVCTPIECGDGVLSAGEQCDDGNQDYDDGCDPSCQLEVFTEIESNNTLQTANDLGNKLFVSGLAESSYSYDWFSVTLPAGELHDLQVRLDDGSGGCPTLSHSLEVRNASNSVLASNSSGSNRCTTLSLEDLAAGTYYLRLYAAYGSSNSPYAIRIARSSIPLRAAGEACDPSETTDRCDGTAICLESGGAAACTAPACGDGVVTWPEECEDGNQDAGDGCDACVFETLTETEPNNTLSRANPLGPNRRAVGVFGAARDHDYYSFTITEPTWFYAYTHGANTVCPSGVTAELALKREDGTVVVQGNSAYSSWACRIVVSSNNGQIRLSPGNYYLDVYASPDSFVSASTLVYLDVRMEPVEVAGLGEACDAWSVICADGQTCLGDPGRCVVSACGDGFEWLDEECDDGNTAAGDGCSEACTFEVSAESEPNDGPLGAEARGAIWASAGEVSGYGSDWNRLDLAQASTLEASISEGTDCGYLSLLVYEPDGITLAAIEQGGSGYCPSLSVDLNAGTYYVVVASTSSSVATGYTLRAKASPR